MNPARQGPAATANARPLPALLAGLVAAARAAPQRPAVVVPGATLPFGALLARVEAAAAGLTAAGICDGARTALLVPPGLDFTVAACALIACGAVPVLVDPGIGIRRIRTALDEAAPVAFVGSVRAHVARRLLGWAPTARHRIVAATPAGWSMGRTSAPSLAALERAGAAAGDAGWRPQPDDAEAAVLFTSGSTGTPKGVVYTHAHVAAQIAALRQVFDLRAGEVNVATFAPFALFGPALGMTTVLPAMDFTRPASADPGRLFATVADADADVMFASPALLDAIARHGERTGAGLPSLRLVLSAGAPVPADLATRTAALLRPSAVVAAAYGMTEALPVCTIDGAGLRATAELHDPPRGVCVGRAVPGTTVVVTEVVDAPVPALTAVQDDGVMGELVVAGPQVTAAYVARPDATARAKTTYQGRAAHRTGDLGWRDDQGRVWFAGRVVHRVPAASCMLDPLPVEQVVSAHPAVQRAALVAVDGDPVVVVQPHRSWWRAARPWRPGGSARRAALLVGLRERLDAHPQTAQVAGVLLRRTFPVDARHNAKVGYEQLARWAAARRRGRWVRVGRRAFGGAAT